MTLMQRFLDEANGNPTMALALACAHIELLAALAVHGYGRLPPAETPRPAKPQPREAL